MPDVILHALRWTRRQLNRAVRHSAPLNRLVWETQYRVGRWRYLDSSDGTGREILQSVTEYVPEPAILDLGCGTTVNLPLEDYHYRHYQGVDLSPTAIARARSLHRPRTSFTVADIVAFARDTSLDTTYDAILLREVVYYFQPSQITPLMRRLASLLTPRGRIFVQVFQTDEVYDALRSAGLEVVEERSSRYGSHTGGLMVLARPR